MLTVFKHHIVETCKCHIMSEQHIAVIFNVPFWPFHITFWLQNDFRCKEVQLPTKKNAQYYSKGLKYRNSYIYITYTVFVLSVPRVKFQRGPIKIVLVSFNFMLNDIKTNAIISME